MSRIANSESTAIHAYGEEIADLMVLAGLDPASARIHRDLPPAPEGLGPGDVLLDFGRDRARGRRLIAALAAGAIAIVEAPFPLAEELARQGAPVILVEACPSALEAALYRIERGGLAAGPEIAAELAFANAWLERYDPEARRALRTLGEGARGEEILVGLGIEAEDRRACGRLSVELERAQVAVLGHRRSPRSSGRGQLEDLFERHELHMLGREHTGVGRRLDFLSRETPPPRPGR